jgi:hypothetical protein
MPNSPNPFAVAAIAAKTPVGSPLNSAGWEKVPLALRESAQFSATIERLRMLQRIQLRVQTAVAMLRREGEGIGGGPGAYQTKEKFVAELQKIAREEGLDPRNFGEIEKIGGLQDVTSIKRLGLIWDIQIEKAQEFAKWKMEQDPDVLNAFPAQELIRVSDRKKKRDWLRRWADAGGRLHGGRMIALKTDRIWIKLNRFGVPWPPFDYSSGMGLRDVSRREAIALKLIKPDERLKPIEQNFNQDLEASVKDLSPKMQSALKRAFGDQVEISEDGMARWKPSSEPPPVPLPPLVPRPPLLFPGAAATEEIAAPAAVEAVSATTLPPGATLVSNATRLELATKKEALRMKEVLSAIDAIHGDGPLQPIPINNKISRGALGTYFRREAAGKSVAVNIGVRRNIGASGELTLAHEIGHWLDHIGIESEGVFASESAPELDGLMSAIRGSDAIKKISADPNMFFKYKNYLLRGREMFARAYSQFVAEESGRQTMLDALQAKSERQWESEDFAPIREEFRKLFRSLGWMN